MRQDTWIRRYLDRYCFIEYHCHLCRDSSFTQIGFACHLVREHEDRTPMLLRFLGADSDVVSAERLNEACRRAQATPRLS